MTTEKAPNAEYAVPQTAIETADYAIALGKGDPTRRSTIALQWLIDRSLIWKAEAI